MNNKLFEKLGALNELSLPATIIIGSIIFGGFYYATEVNKQESIDRQQKINNQQEDREYASKRRDECYTIYERERKQYSNVIASHYYEPSDNPYDYMQDKCEVTYKDEKTEKEFNNYF